MARSTTRSDAREAVIGRSTRIRGRISGDGDLVIEGTVEGDVDVGTVTVRGEVDGDIRARGSVRVESGGRVRGDVFAEREFSLEDGAEFVGNIQADFEMPAELGGAPGAKRR